MAGDGDVYGPSGGYSRNSGITYGVGDTVMFCYDPATREVWYGVNGVWDSDPVSGSGSWVQPNENQHVYGQARYDTNKMTLVGNSADFDYSIPSGAVALDTLYE